MSEERKNSRLGKGLSALIGEYDTFEAPEGASDSVKEIQMLRMAQVRANPQQPRKQFDEKKLAELTASVKAHGVLTPILVREVDHADYKFQIIAGERRFRASKAAELEEIPARILKTNDLQLLEIGLIENVQREDLNAMEEAQALDRLMNEFELTHQEVAEAVGKSRTTITNLLRLNNLNDDVKLLVEHGDIEMGHARALLALEGESQSDAAQIVSGKALTVRDTEKLVRKILEPAEPKPPKEIDPDVKSLVNKLSDNLGAKVSIDHNAKGKGKLVINFNDLDQLDGILSRIK